MTNTRGAAWLVALTLACACAAVGEGETDVTAYGEGYIEEGIAADVFVDGWSVTFDHFVVVVSDVGVGEEGGDPRAFLVDLTKKTGGEGQPLTGLVVPIGDYSQLFYRVAPAADVEALDVDQAVVDAVAAAGASVYVEGTATRDAEVITFRWAFTANTGYGPCEIEASVTRDASASAELTFHADHLFYDDLDSAAPNVAFELIAAADVDLDGEVSEAELRAVDITGEQRYQVGSRDIADLWSFIEHQSGTIGHINGEGHCEAAG